MKLKKIPFWEANSRIVAYVSVIILTVICLYTFIISEAKFAFEITMMYTLFLYIIGDVGKEISKSSESRFYDRQEYLVNLHKLKGLLPLDPKNSNDLDYMRRQLIHIMVFTSTDEEFAHKSYIDQRFFRFTKLYMSLKKRFEDLYGSITSELNEAINSFYENKGIKRYSGLWPDILEKNLQFESEEICRSCSLQVSDAIQLQMIFEKIKTKRKKDLSFLKFISKVVQHIISVAVWKVNANIRKILKIYGGRITEDLDRNYSIQSTLYDISDKLKSVETQIDYIQENSENIITSIENIEESSEFKGIQYQIDEIGEKVGELVLVIDELVDKIDSLPWQNK